MGRSGPVQGNGRTSHVPLRWCVVTDDHPTSRGPFGGVATWSALAADALGARVLARARPGLLGATGVRGPSFQRWGALWTLAHRPWDADVVLATTWRSAWAVAPICAARGVPLHVVVHGSDARDPGLRRLVGPVRRWAVSADLARRVPGDVRVLPCPIDPGPLAPGRPGPWVMVARAVPSKGGDRFVRLVAAARARGVVVGDGPDRARWEGLARRLHADVRFAGALPRDQVLEQLGAGGVAFLLSRPDPRGAGEGLGLALLEAASRGVPVVGCRTGGIPEAVGPGLVLDDPDDVRGSVGAIEAWWRPDRGREAHAWLARVHGAARFRATLESDHRPVAS